MVARYVNKWNFGATLLLMMTALETILYFEQKATYIHNLEQNQGMDQILKEPATSFKTVVSFWGNMYP